MNIRTSLLEEYVNFVDNTKKQNKILWIYIIFTFLYSVYTYNNIIYI